MTPATHCDRFDGPRPPARLTGLGKWNGMYANSRSANAIILLVSNPIDERAVYTRVLRASGYGVVSTATTVLANQIAIARPTDIVVVTDGRCPGSMSGLELTRRLRLHTRTTTVPIIVITSETRRPVANCELKLGQTRSGRNQYREICYANKWYGDSWRAGVSVASCRRSTNSSVRSGPSEGARSVADSWNIGTSRRSSRRWKCPLASHDTGCAMCRLVVH